MRSGCTQIIGNDRGHLNSNIPRSPASPWGSFVGTWQAERKPIKLRTRTKLMAHLSLIDKQGGGSKHSSRAASACMSRESQRGGMTSPRPQSAQASQREDQETQPAASPGSGEAQHSTQPPDTGSKASEADSKPPTPAAASEAGSKPPTPAKGGENRPATGTSSEQGSQAHDSNTPSAVRDRSQTATPQSSGPRTASAASTRSSMCRTPVSSTPSRAQSATARQHTPHKPPPGSAGSSVPPSSRREGTQTPLSIPTPHDPTTATAAANSNGTSENSSRAQTAASDHPLHNQ